MSRKVDRECDVFLLVGSCVCVKCSVGFSCLRGMTPWTYVHIDHLCWVHHLR